MTGSTPMISARSLGAMPQVVLEIGGNKGIIRALSRSGLPYRFIDSRDGYIPENCLASFIDEVGHTLGERSIALKWIPYITVKDYGTWGGYVLSAPTIAQALLRAKTIMPFHSNADKVFFQTTEKYSWYGYSFGLRDHSAYPNIAYTAIAAMLSIFHHYLKPGWTPEAIYFDFSRGQSDREADLMFRCPLYWDMPRLGFRFDSSILSAKNPSNHNTSIITIDDIARERGFGPPQRFKDVVTQVLLLQIDESFINQERVAAALDVSVRSLQRRLSKEGTSFRELCNVVKIGRAKEYLKHGMDNITTISTLLGYTSPNNFTRAFRSAAGISPTEYKLSEGNKIR